MPGAADRPLAEHGAQLTGARGDRAASSTVALAAAAARRSRSSTAPRAPRARTRSPGPPARTRCTSGASSSRLVVGLSPGQLVVRARVDHARALLAGTDVPLSEVATACGSYDQPAFSRQFARLAGETPGQYRRRARR